MALLDLFVDSFNLYIQSIDDPFYRFVEFNMRFCVFRNMLLSLEVPLIRFRTNSASYLKITASSASRS